jgi:hypothetical protein
VAARGTPIWAGAAGVGTSPGKKREIWGDSGLGCFCFGGRRGEERMCAWCRRKTGSSLPGELRICSGGSAADVADG